MVSLKEVSALLNISDIGSSMREIDLSKYQITYPYVLDFEKNYDPNYGIVLMEKYKWIVYPIIVLYLIAIVSLQNYMKDRPAFNLRMPLFLWNFGWAVFAFFTFARLHTEFIFVLKEFGLTATICLPKFGAVSPMPIPSLWTLFFVWSKVGELGDTIFLILRKRNVIFLHWYHHATALFYCWISYSEGVSTARIFAVMNCFVHSVMYMYFALSALNIKFPRMIASCITVTQIMQMVVASSIIIWAYFVKKAGNKCHVSFDNIHISLSIYFSYVVLFTHFFVKAYITKGSAKNKNQIYEKKGISNKKKL